MGMLPVLSGGLVKCYKVQSLAFARRVFFGSHPEKIKSVPMDCLVSRKSKGFGAIEKFFLAEEKSNQSTQC